ncbi:DMT family transporter [Paralcaligenes ginsengisoli]
MNSIGTQLLLIGTMAVWGLNISAIKVLTDYFDPMVIACFRMVLAAVVIDMSLVWSRRPVKLLRISAGQWLRFVLCAAFLVYGNQVFFTSGMHAASATNSSLIMALSPLVASALAALVFRESLTGIRLLGIALGFGGVFAVVFGSQDAALSGPGRGDLQVFCSMLSFVVGGMLIQTLARQFNALVITSIVYTLGAALLCLHLFVSGTVGLGLSVLLAPGAWPWLLMVFSGIIATAMCNVLWNRAIAELGVARTSLYQYWIPVFGVGFAMLLLGEPFTVWHGVGLLGILLGTYLGTRRPVVLAAKARA